MKTNADLHTLTTEAALPKGIRIILLSFVARIR